MRCCGSRRATAARGAVETIGFWTGADHRAFVIGGQSRTCYAAGSLIDVDPIRSQTGLKVRTQRVRLSQIAPEVLQAVRGYDPRHCPAQLHRVMFDAETEQMLEEPHRVFKGFVDKMRLTTPPKGKGGGAELTLASAARGLTVPVSTRRSDASLRARVPGDGFRKYAAVADSETWWGRNPPKPPGERSGPTTSPFSRRREDER